MKLNLKAFAIVTVASLSLLSCNDEDASIDTTIYYSARAIVASEEGEPLIFRTDGNNQLTITSDYSGYAPEQNQRVLITYSIEDRLNNTYDILTKEVIELTAENENENEMGNDAIHLYDTWCAGGLNINWGMNVSGKITHYVNLVENTLISNPQSVKLSTIL